jgi:hypothetical protein
LWVVEGVLVGEVYQDEDEEQEEADRRHAGVWDGFTVACAVSGD